MGSQWLLPLAASDSSRPALERGAAGVAGVWLALLPWCRDATEL